MREKILDKIAKLLALSGSDNQHEAELAALRASELMTKHQIDMSEVLVKDTTIEEQYYEVDGQKMKLLWIETLAYGCAKLFDGVILCNSKLHGTSFNWVGHKADIEVMQALFEHLYKSWFSIVKKDLVEAKSQHEIWLPKDTMSFKAGHGNAYAKAIFYRCEALAEARKEKVSATGTDLVVLKDQALAEYGEQNGWIKTNPKVSLGSVIGALAGYEAGTNAALGGAVE